MNNPTDKKKIFIISGVVALFVIALSVVALVLAFNFKSNVVLGNWNQTAAGLGFDEEVGPEPDYVEFKGDNTVKWYANVNDKTKNYMVGKYSIENGNKTNDSGEDTVGDYKMYTLTVKPDYYLDADGKNIKFSGSDLKYLVYVNPNESTLIRLINTTSFRGYLMEIASIE